MIGFTDTNKAYNSNTNTNTASSRMSKKLKVIDIDQFWLILWMTLKLEIILGKYYFTILNGQNWDKFSPFADYFDFNVQIVS